MRVLIIVVGSRGRFPTVFLTAFEILVQHFMMRGLHL